MLPSCGGFQHGSQQTAQHLTPLTCSSKRAAQFTTEWHPQGRGIISCMLILFLVYGIQMARAARCGNHHPQAHVILNLDRSRPLTSSSETPTKQSNSSDGTNRDLSTSIPVSLSAVAGGVKPAQPPSDCFNPASFFFFFAEKTFHTQSKNNSLRLAVW